MKETNKELLQRFNATNKLRKQAKTLTRLELIEKNKNINEHIVSNTWYSVNGDIDIEKELNFKFEGTG